MINNSILISIKATKQLRCTLLTFTPQTFRFPARDLLSAQFSSIIKQFNWMKKNLSFMGVQSLKRLRVMTDKVLLMFEVLLGSEK